VTVNLVQIDNVTRILYSVENINLYLYFPHLEPGVDGRIILRWIFSNCDVGFGTGSSWIRIGTGGRYM